MNTAPTSLTTRAITPDPAGTGIARYLIARAKGDDAIAFAESHPGYRSTPHIVRVLKAEAAGATTTDSDYAAPLAAFGLSDELFGLLRETSAVAALAPRFRRVPFLTPIVVEDTGAAAAWIPEGAAAPVTIAGFSQASVPPGKAGLIVVMTRELLIAGNPVAERAIATAIARAVGRFLDTALLDPDIAAVVGMNPASITNGVTPISSSGTSSAQITTDLAALIAAVTSPGPFVFVMQPATFMTIALKVPGIATATTLLGVPVVLAPYGPQQITILDAQEILYAEDRDRTELAISRAASIRMDDGLSPPATTILHLFQTNNVAFRVAVFVAWLRVRDGAVAYMETAY